MFTKSFILFYFLNDVTIHLFIKDHMDLALLFDIVIAFLSKSHSHIYLFMRIERNRNYVKS